MGDLSKSPDVFNILVFEDGAPLDVGVDAVEHVADPQKEDDLPVVEKLFLQRPCDCFFARVLFPCYKNQGGFLIVPVGPPFCRDAAFSHL